MVYSAIEGKICTKHRRLRENKRDKKFRRGEAAFIQETSRRLEEVTTTALGRRTGWGRRRKTRTRRKPIDSRNTLRHG